MLNYLSTFFFLIFPFIPLSFLLSPLLLPLLLLLLCLLFSFQPSTPTSAVKQTVLWVDNKIKKKKLFDLLEDPKYYHPPIVVFVDSKKGADMLAEAVTQVLGGEEDKGAGQKEERGIKSNASTENRDICSFDSRRQDANGEIRSPEVIHSRRAPHHHIYSGVRKRS